MKEITDKQIKELLKIRIMKMTCNYPEQGKKTQGIFRKSIPYIIFALLIISFAFLLAFSHEETRQKILEFLFLQHLLFH